MSAAPNAVNFAGNSPVPQILVCPRDRLPFRYEPGWLVCPAQHRYAVVEDVPILLISEMSQTHIEGSRSLKVAEAPDAAQLPQFKIVPGIIDPFVQNSISATNGSLYRHLVGRLTEYPVPDLKLPQAEGKSFLEIGCNWGRWCIAAARKGYQPTGVDPSLKSIRAARRVARQLNVAADYLVADGRSLPFPDASFDCVFSYSVLQHLSKENTRTVLREARRVLRPGACCLVQMPNKLGTRNLYHQGRRRFREAVDFEVRYWGISELKDAFEQEIGPAEVFVDGYLTLNPQVNDAHLFPLHYRALVHVSDLLRRASRFARPLMYLADSLYVRATRMT
jgi:SAM-dependent methyltransferase/uncharacterized protein YbaR (Trm112 family)